MDRQIRISTVAHNLLGRKVEGKEGDRVLGALYGEMGYRTRAVSRVPGAASVVRDVAMMGISLSIAGILSDFEWACRDFLADLLEFWGPCFKPSLGNVKPPPANLTVLAKRGWAGSLSEALRSQSADEGFLQACYSLIGVVPPQADLALLPVFDFFRRCRNRILHQDGRAGSELIDFSKSTELQKAFKSLAPRVLRMTPDLPSLAESEPIVLTPAHAILFLVVVQTLFNALAYRVRSKLDENGYLRMVAHYAYGSSHHPFRQDRYKDVLYPATTFLRQRYTVGKLNKEELIRRFRRLGLWDAMLVRFNALFPTTPGIKFSPL